MQPGVRRSSLSDSTSTYLHILVSVQEPFTITKYKNKLWAVSVPYKVHLIHSKGLGERLLKGYFISLSSPQHCRENCWTVTAPSACTSFLEMSSKEMKPKLNLTTQKLFFSHKPRRFLLIGTEGTRHLPDNQPFSLFILNVSPQWKFSFLFTHICFDW